MTDKIKMKLQCPMPKMDYDIITLGHGSGGKLTNRLLDKTVFDIFKNDLIETRHDGAIFQIDGKVVFSTDSFVVSPIFFPGGNIGELSVNGTVNDIAMCGGIPNYLSLSFIIEEGFKMTEFWDVLLGIKFACEKAGVEVVTGDTKVVEKGKGDKIFVNTTGIGVLHPKANISSERIKPGDKIIISGDIAAHGIAILSVRRGLEFETDILSDSANLNHTVVKLLDEFGEQIHLLRDPTRGGVAATLNEISRDTQLGYEINEKDIPVNSQVAAACEIMGLDPLYVANEGVFIAIVSGDIASDFVAKLRDLEYGKNASIIGEVLSDHGGKVLIQNEIGGKRVVHMQVGEQLPRIC